MLNRVINNESWLNSYPWESVEQKKGFLSLLKHLSDLRPNVRKNMIGAICAYFIQKDHESSEWFVEILGDRVRRLEDEIVLLREELRKQNDVVR